LPGNQTSGRRIGDPATGDYTMKKLVLMAMAALGLSLAVGAAQAATAQDNSNNLPRVIHWGPDYGNDSASSN
jgi:hypothetical protein